MKMFKIIKKDFWKDKNGNKRNWIKYMKSENIEEVILYFGIDNIKEVKEI